MDNEQQNSHADSDHTELDQSEKDPAERNLDEQDQTNVDFLFGGRVALEKLVDLKQFEILEKIGEGAMGVVYSARHKTLGKIVALKVLATDRTDAAMVRFHNEAKTLSRLRNKFIAEVYDFGVSASGVPFMAIEFVNGPTLQQMIEEQGSMPLSEVTVMATEICQALEHAHQKGVIHRDVKPGNVIFEITDDRTLIPKVVDFGVAKSIDQVTEVTRTGRMVGSPLYISPEQSFGKEVTAQSDMYSLGCVIYYCLTGRPPLRGETILDTIRMQREQKAPSLLKQFPKDGHTPELIKMSKIIERMLAKDPAQRFNSMREVELQLEQTFDTEEANESPQEVPRKEEPPITLTEKASNKSIILIALCMLIPLSIFIFKQLSSSFNVGPQTTINEPELPDSINESTVESKISSTGGSAVSQRGQGSFPTPPTTQDSVGPVLDRSLDRQASVKQLARGIKDNSIIFYFRDCFLKDEDLALFENYTNAQYVNLRKVNITEAGLKHLHNNKIQRLDISRTQVTTLQDLPGKSSLVALNLSDNRINDKSIENLKSCTNLQWLECNGTYISPEAIQKLSPNVPLQFVWCDKWKRADIAKLEETFPNCTFNQQLSYMHRRSQDANALMKKGRLEDALKLFSGILQQGKEQKNVSKEIAAMIGVAEVLSYLGRKDEALQYFKKAIARGEESQERWQLLFAIMKYMDYGSDLYLDTPASRRITEATVGRYVELLDKYEPNVFKHSEFLHDFGSKMLRRNQPQLAEMLFEKSLVVQRKSRSEARLIYNPQLDDALATEKTRDVWQDEDDMLVAATTVELARTMSVERKINKARKLFRQAIVDLETVTNPKKNKSGIASKIALNQLMATYLYAAQFERSCGDRKKAFEYMNKCEVLMSACHVKPPREYLEERQRMAAP